MKAPQYLTIYSDDTELELVAIDKKGGFIYKYVKSYYHSGNITFSEKQLLYFLDQKPKPFYNTNFEL